MCNVVSLFTYIRKENVKHLIRILCLPQDTALQNSGLGILSTQGAVSFPLSKAAHNSLEVKSILVLLWIRCRHFEFLSVFRCPIVSGL